MNDDQNFNDDNQRIDYAEPKKNKALPFFIVLFVASLGLNIWMFYNYAKKAKQVEQNNVELTLLYEQANLRADSLQNELDFVNAQLQDKINELLAQQDLKESLRSDLENQKRKLNNAYARISRLIANGGNESGSTASDGPKTLAQAKRQIQLLQNSNEAHVAKIEETQKQYEVAKFKAVEFESTAKVFRIENDSLIEVTSELKNQLMEASVLNIQGLTVVPQREKRGETIVAIKSGKVENLKVDFSTVKSGLTPKEKKELKIRIISPTGEVLSESTNDLTDISKVFSMYETITYDGTEKRVTMFYTQKAAYKPGTYHVEVYHEDKLLDNTRFSLR